MASRSRPLTSPLTLDTSWGKAGPSAQRATLRNEVNFPPVWLIHEAARNPGIFVSLRWALWDWGRGEAMGGATTGPACILVRTLVAPWSPRVFGPSIVIAVCETKKGLGNSGCRHCLFLAWLQPSAPSPCQCFFSFSCRKIKFVDIRNSQTCREF